jgi:cyclohexanecarboxyl-CoA dehydrogenase
MPPVPPLPPSVIGSKVREVAERLHLRQRSSELDLAPEFPWVEFRELASAGLIGLRTPVATGGQGLSLVEAGEALFHLGYWGGTTFAKLSLQPEFSSVLAEHGRPEDIARYFRPMVRGELVVGNQVTEPGAGSDAGAIQFEAQRSGEEYVLNGTKSEVAFAQDAQVALVYAQVAPRSGPDRGLTVLLVPQDLPGIERSSTPDLGERWMRRGTVRYREVRIPLTARIGDEGRAFEYLKHELTRERALLAAIYLGVARASWEETVERVGQRQAFGGSLARQEAVSFPLVEDWARLESSWLFVRSVLERLDRGEPAVAAAALAKWMSVEVSLESLDHAIQFHGGRGYSKELPHEQRWRDVRSGAIAHGPSEIMHLIAARELWPARDPKAS